jgi:hypothetical protein
LTLPQFGQLAKKTTWLPKSRQILAAVNQMLTKPVDLAPIAPAFWPGAKVGENGEWNRE